ncbi:MAG: hypothetical protein ACOY3P_04965 [Planctomycetota bacterium]
MNEPTELHNGQPKQFYNCAAAALLIVVGLAAWATWQMYPAFIDTYYHMAVIEGFRQAGGISTWAFWEMAPGGRVHIYPPALHVIGYFFQLLGVSPGMFMTLVSASFYGLCLLTTWVWLRGVVGERAALLSIVLLSGPWTFFWTQATFQAVAGVLVLAPLCLWALEKERFLACGVLNFVATTMHPMGLFLPPALVINTLLRRKKIASGLLAASLPVVLYSPWLMHIWANRAFLSENRTGGEVSLSGVGGGANLGLLLAPFALLGIGWLIARRGPSLGLVGALLGFVVVFPMGFGSRFLQFNIHWPLACLAGYGLSETIAWCERHARLRLVGQIVGLTVTALALVAYPALNLPAGGGPGFRRARDEGGRSERSSTARLENELRNMAMQWRVTVQSSALPKLFDMSSGNASMGMGPPGMGPGGMGGPGMGGGNRGQRDTDVRSGGDADRESRGRDAQWQDRPGMWGPPSFGPPGMGPPGMFGPGMGSRDFDPRDMDFRPGDGRADRQSMAQLRGKAKGKRDSRYAADRGSGRGGFGMRGGPGMGGGPGIGSGPGMGGAQGAGGAPGMGAGQGSNLLTRPGATEFFDAVRTHVAPGDIIYIQEGVTANLIVGATGRWTTSGILRDVRADQPRAKIEECDFAMTTGGGMGMPGPGGAFAAQELPADFKKVFENDFGALYRNPAKVEHARQPLKAEVQLWALLIMALVGVSLLTVDVLLPQKRLVRPIVAGVGTLIVAACLGPLTAKAIDELRNPPQAPPRGQDGPPGFGDPGMFLGSMFVREADTDQSYNVSLAEFKSLAGRWFDDWDTNEDRTLVVDEVTEGLQSALGSPPDMAGPMPMNRRPFGPEVFLAEQVFDACDANGDNELTRGEMVVAFEKWYRQWDETKKDSLDAGAIADGMLQIVGPPQTF